MKKEVTWCGCTKITDTKWLSHKTKKFFDVTANWLTTDSANSYFISNKKRFIYGNKMDIRWLMNYYAPFIGKEVIVNEEIMYSNLPALRKFEGSKILVVGGGPSAKEVDWDPKRYDYVFSCNHFYHNEKLNKHNVALACFSGETDFTPNNKKLYDYLDKNDTIICFEDKSLVSDQKHFKYMKDRYPLRTMFSHTRYRGKPGTMPRLLCLALFLSPREVHFVGMDGMRPHTKRGDLHNHAFQEGKRYSHKHIDYDLYTRHYVAFWNYILNDLELHKKITLQNLGEGHPANQTTDISRQIFPLKKENLGSI